MPRRPENLAQPENVRGPLPFAPKGLSRLEAARHVGVSPTTFDVMVGDGRMPRPKTVGARVLWDRMKIEAFFEALPEQGDSTGSAGDSFADWQ